MSDRERLARDIRRALGELNDDAEPVVLLVSGLAVRIKDLEAINLGLTKTLVEMDVEKAKLVGALHEGRRAIGDHYVPDDCYATGPVTGDPFRDLVQCPACSFIAVYDEVLTTYRKQEGEE